MKKKYVFEVELDDAAVQKIGASGVSDTVAGVVQELSRGGMLLPAEVVKRIQRAAGDPSPMEIAEKVERGCGKRGDALLVEFSPDPSWTAYLQEVASRNGISIQQHLRAIFDWAFSQGWFGMVAPEPHKILLTEAQYRRIGQMLGKEEFTGQDLMDFLDGEIGLGGLDSDEDVVSSVLEK